MEQKLSGQVAVISGGLGDIGRAIALQLARHGADIAIGDIRPSPDAEPILREIAALGRRARYDLVDVGQASQVDGWVGRVADDLGTPTLAIPNAAVVTLLPTCSMSAEQWMRELRINLDGAFFVAQASARRMIEAAAPGRIVFIGSWAAHAPHVHIPAYCASKAGVRMLCKVMALELAPNGILVNEVAPGYVDAGLTGKIWAENPAARISGANHVPTGQLITADEVAYQVAHLCDPHNRHMTGTTLIMDGGLSLTNASTARTNER